MAEIKRLDTEWLKQQIEEARVKAERSVNERALELVGVLADAIAALPLPQNVDAEAMWVKIYKTTEQGSEINYAQIETGGGGYLLAGTDFKYSLGNRCSLMGVGESLELLPNTKYRVTLTVEKVDE